MPAHSIFSDAHREFIHQAYMRQCLQPAAITTMLNERFGTTYKLGQVQRLINYAEWSKKRKKVIAKGRAIGEASVNKLAREHANKNQAAFDRFAQKSEKLADKALDMAVNAVDARSMASAAAAAKSAIAMYRVTSGLDGVGTGGRATQFNFNFGNMAISPAGSQPSVEVEVSAVSDGMDVDDDDDLGGDEDS